VRLKEVGLRKKEKASIKCYLYFEKFQPIYINVVTAFAHEHLLSDSECGEDRRREVIFLCRRVLSVFGEVQDRKFENFVVAHL
jgi:hypothetical protein